MAAVGETNIHVQVNGTTFAGIYEMVGSAVELTSADFGERSEEAGNKDPQAVAEQMLQVMAEEAMRSSDALFLRDDGTVATPVEDQNS